MLISCNEYSISCIQMSWMLLAILHSHHSTLSIFPRNNQKFFISRYYTKSNGTTEPINRMNLLSTALFHSQDFVKRSADPLTPRRTSSLGSKYVPQTIFDRSKISGGTCVLTSRTTVLAMSTLVLNGSSRLIVSSTSCGVNLATGRVDGNSLKGIAFLHFLPENFRITEFWEVDEGEGNFPVVLSSLRYSRLPAVNLNMAFTCSLPVVPDLSWGQFWFTMTVKPMSEVNERLVLRVDVRETVRWTSPMRTRAEGWRRVRPMCRPVEYSNRHFPGSNSSQFCALRTRMGIRIDQGRKEIGDGK